MTEVNISVIGRINSMYKEGLFVVSFNPSINLRSFLRNHSVYFFCQSPDMFSERKACELFKMDLTIQIETSLLTDFVYQIQRQVEYLAFFANVPSIHLPRCFNAFIINDQIELCILFILKCYNPYLKAF